MKSLFTVLFLILFCSLNSCKKENQDVDVTQSEDVLKPTYYLTDKNVAIDFSNGDNSLQVIGIGKVMPNEKTEISRVFFRNTKINSLEIIDANDDYLIKSIKIISPISNREIRFSNYNLQEKKVTIELVNLATSISLVKVEVDLTSESVNLLNSLQASSKSLAGARLASQDCNIVAGGFKTFFTSVECLVGAILVPSRNEICEKVNAGLPTALANWAFPCNSAGADAFTKAKDLACKLKNDYFDKEVLPCLPDGDKDLDDFNTCLENSSKPPVLIDQAWDNMGKCFEDFNRKKKEKENQKKNPPSHATGDPHLMTLDGVSYDFQGHGEFVTTKSTVDNFEIQVRQEDVYKSGIVTTNTGIAVQTGTDKVCVTVNPKRIFINNQAQDFVNFTSASLKEGASVAKTKENGGDALLIISKNGDLVKVVFPQVEYLDYFLYLPDNRKGKVIGLMGNYDGDKNNDILTRSGENILVDNSLAFNKLYPVYADSWRVTQANSLFYYEAGKNTETYTQKDFPKTIQTLTTAQKVSAENVCRAAGVTTEPFLSNCIFDVAITNNPKLAISSYNGQQLNNRTASLTVPIIQEAVNIKSIVMILGRTYILKPDGSLWASGAELPNGLPQYISTNNIFVKIMDNIKDVANGTNGYNHMLFIKNDNTVWGYGNNASGQIGNGTTNVYINPPIKILNDAITTEVSGSSSFIVKTDNSLWALGAGAKLITGVDKDNYLPIKVMDNVKEISLSNTNLLILKTDNTLWGSGDNRYGGLSNQNLASFIPPIKIMDNVKSFGLGSYNCWILKNDNTLWAAGLNSGGELGIGTSSPQIGYVKVMNDVRNFSASAQNCYLIKLDNTLWAAGKNGSGQLGINTTTDKNTFVMVSSNVKFVKTSTYSNSAFIIKDDNTLWAVGENKYGQLGDGTTGVRYSFVPINLK